MDQIKVVVKFAKKYPKGDNWMHVWMFDYSSCHAVMPDVSKMNVNPDDKQRVIQDGGLCKMGFRV